MGNRLLHIWLIAVLGALLVILSACSDLIGKPTEIKNGFTEKLTGALKSDYDLTVPDSAEFSEGRMENSIKDPYIHLWFRMPENAIGDMLSSEWKDVSEQVSGDVKGTPAAKVWFKSSEKSAYLFIDTPDNGFVNVFFNGENPSKKWLK